MRQFHLISIGLLIAIASYGQEYSRKELKYKPKNLDEALLQLDKWFSDSTKQNIKSMTEKDFVAKSDFGLGMTIRNDWGLWRKHELAKYFNGLGVNHPDDMSGVILRSYYRKLIGSDLRVKEQVDEINQFYKNMDDPEWRKQNDINFWTELMATYHVGDTLTNHIYYDRHKWSGNPRKNTVLTAVLVDKRERELKLDFVAFGTETDTALVFKEIACTSGDCWVNPRDWRKKKS